MKPEGSLPCSQQHAIGPYPKPDESCPHFSPYFSKIRCNIISPSTRSSSEWSPGFSFTDQNLVSISHLPCTYYLITKVYLKPGDMNGITD